MASDLGRLTPPGRTYYTRAEVAKLFEVAPNTASRWARDGRLPCVRTPGGRRRYMMAPIRKLLHKFRASG